MRLPTATISSKTIYQLLNDREVYVIPSFQREYSWGVAEINELISDIVSSFDTKSEILLGQIQFLSFDQHFFNVIDGQQRLTSIFLLLSTILELYPDENKFLDRYLTVRDSRKGTFISYSVVRELEDGSKVSLFDSIKNIDYYKDIFKQIVINLVKYYGTETMFEKDGFVDFVLDKIIFITTTFVSNSNTDEAKYIDFVNVLTYFFNLNTKGKPFDKGETETLIQYLKYRKIGA